MTKKATLTTGEAAKYCGVNFRTIIRWIERGHLKAYKLPGRGDNRIPVGEFLKFLERSEIPIPEELLVEGGLEDDLYKPHILIVDDDENMARSIQRVFNRQGWQSTIGKDGFEAGALLTSLQPAAMTLDLRMPSLDGLSVLKYMQTHSIKTKVLVISAELQEKLDEAKALGAHDTLSKPFENKELAERMKRLLNI